eukprot:767948-Hanusia_phi.AAC.8
MTQCKDHSAQMSCNEMKVEEEREEGGERDKDDQEESSQQRCPSMRAEDRAAESATFTLASKLPRVAGPDRRGVRSTSEAAEGTESWGWSQWGCMSCREFGPILPDACDGVKRNSESWTRQP